jgi:predicted phosphodiesterase
MKMVIYSDIHYYGADPVPVSDMPKTYEEVIATNSVSTGDNYDVRNAAHKHVEKCRAELAEHQAIFKERYVSGNHDLEMTNIVSKVGNVLITHGDWYIFWDETRATEFRTQSAGQGAFSRLWKFGASQIRNITGAKMSNDEIYKAVMLAKTYGCGTIVMGHSHPAKVFDKTVNGVRVINVPRGRTEIEI